MKVGILSSDVLSLIPYKARSALLGLPVPFDEFGVTVVGHQAKCVHAEAVLSTSQSLISRRR